MQLVGTGTTDPRWLEKIIAHPPTSLSTLEYWVGALDVDFASAEGMTCRSSAAPARHRSTTCARARTR
jgi:hypothetical protein